MSSIAWQKTLRKLPHGPFASSYCILYFSSKRPVLEAGIENLSWAGAVLSDVCVSQQRDIRGRAGNPSSSRSPSPAELPPLRVCREGCGFPRDTLFYQCSHGWARSALGWFPSSAFLYLNLIAGSSGIFVILVKEGSLGSLKPSLEAGVVPTTHPRG